MSVVLGLVTGYLLMFFRASTDVLKLIGLPGELFFRLLKCLVLPLVFSSIVSSFAAIGAAQRGKIGGLAFLWYVITTVSPYFNLENEFEHINFKKS